MGTELGPTIAERELTIKSKRRTRIVVRLGMPRQESPAVPQKSRLPVWMCPFQISGVGRSRVDRALGLDGVQALQLAMQAIRLQLRRYATGAKWEGGEDGDPGFPEVVPSLGLAFATRMSRVISREEKRYVREIIRKRGQTKHKRRNRQSGGENRRQVLTRTIHARRATWNSPGRRVRV